MRLKDETPWPHDEVGCYICQHAGEDLELWPLDQREIITAPGSRSIGGYWFSFVKNLETGRSGGGHRSRKVCAYHWSRVREVWEHIAQLEVDQARAWDAYCERIER